MTKEKKPRRPITLELAVAAQITYQQEHQQERQAQGDKSQLQLNPGWGGKGR